MNIISELVIAASCFIYACAHMIDAIHDIIVDLDEEPMPESVKHLYQ